MLASGNDLYNKVNPLIIKEELNIFNKLHNEIHNFKNLIKLLLGKRVRIKAKKFYEQNQYRYAYITKFLAIFRR